MAATVEQLQTQLDALRAVRWGGEKRILFKGPNGEQEVEYKSDAELAAAIFDLERQINLASGAGRANTVRIFSSKGT
jgi:hypothetical protein